MLSRWTLRRQIRSQGPPFPFSSVSPSSYSLDLGRRCSIDYEMSVWFPIRETKTSRKAFVDNQPEFPDLVGNPLLAGMGQVAISLMGVTLGRIWINRPRPAAGTTGPSVYRWPGHELPIEDQPHGWFVNELEAPCEYCHLPRGCPLPVPILGKCSRNHGTILRNSLPHPWMVVLSGPFTGSDSETACCINALRPKCPAHARRDNSISDQGLLTLRSRLVSALGAYLDNVPPEVGERGQGT
jgi:hypothetical protein